MVSRPHSRHDAAVYGPYRKAAAITASLCLACGVAAALFWPLPEELQSLTPPAAQRFLDRHGRVLYVIPTETGIGGGSLTLADVPDICTQALLATEDRTFYSHPGVSLRGLLRAVTQNVTTGSVVSGGSTVTQQLVRTRLQPARRTLAWKIREAWLALRLELHVSKEDILAAYLAGTYFGHQAVGLRSAADVYLGKSLHEVSTGECALLIGLLQSPSRYDPYVNLEAALARRRRVLQALLATNVIDDAEYERAEREPVQLSHGTHRIEAPHFVLWLRDKTLLGARETVHTTLDANLQRELEDIVSRQLEKLADKNVGSAAVVVLDAHTGDVLGMVGSGDYYADDAGAFNAALAARQPGSTLKPFTYALALAQGDTAATVVADTTVQFQTGEGTPYTPRNYDYEEHGPVRYREALANSYNIAAVKVLERVGVIRLLALLRSLGIRTLTQSPDHYGLALTLGDAEVPLLELVQAYGALARGGVTLPVRTRLTEETTNGTRVFSPEIAWLITDILSDPDARLAEFGADSPLAFPFPVAAKTGTTRNSRDNWVVGYTPDRVVGVWVGNPDNTPMRGTSGITGAGPVFHDAMLAATQGLPPASFARPKNIVTREVCALSGKLPTPACRERVTENFIAGTEPTEPDTVWQHLTLDVRNGLRAGTDCPPQHTVTQLFAVFPLELQRWAREAGYAEAPRTYSPLCPRTTNDDPAPASSRAAAAVTITSPHDGDRFLLDPLIRNQDETITFLAEADDEESTGEWLVDGVSVGTASQPNFRLLWRPSTGTHIVEFRLKNERASLRISVENQTESGVVPD